MPTPDDLPGLKTRLKETSLFVELPEAALDRLAGAVWIRQAPAGQLICTRNSPGDEFYVVLEGEVELFIATHPAVPEDPLRDKLMKNATDAVVRVVSPGEYFGELACLVENGTRTATAIAPRGCKLLVVPRDVLIEILRQFPDAALAILRQIADRLRWHTDHLARTVRKDGLVRPEDRAVRDRVGRTWWQWLADAVIGFFAHPICSIGHAVWWLYWFKQLDQAIPFTSTRMTVDLLTNIVSLEAIVLAIAILVAQRRKDEKDESREQVQFTNTSVTVEQTTVILHRLIQLEAELRHERLKAGLRHRPDSASREHEAEGAHPPR